MTSGEHLGSYQILSLLGKGGMGEVYRARDSKLNREVAIKILPEEFTNDAERVARFHREAQSVAALNHPNIAAIYDFAESNTTRFAWRQGDPVFDSHQRAHQDCSAVDRLGPTHDTDGAAARSIDCHY
jgi:hypothetical protein